MGPGEERPGIIRRVINTLVPRPIRLVVSFIYTFVVHRPNFLVIFFYLALWCVSAIIAFMVFFSSWLAPVQHAGDVFIASQPPHVKPLFSEESFPHAIGAARYPPVYNIVCIAGYGASLALFVYLCLSDPGYTDRLSSGQAGLIDLYPHDHQFYHAVYCHTCGKLKPARSKHCKVCNTCVLRFDHHCIWLNNDVGLFNHGWFLLFLVLHGLGMSFMAAIQLFIFFDLKRTMAVTRPWALVRFISAYCPAFMMGALFNGVMGLALLAFSGLHIYLLGRNLTTNEMAKRQDAGYDVKDGDAFVLWSRSKAVASVPRIKRDRIRPKPLWEIIPEQYSEPKSAIEAKNAARYYVIDQAEAKVAFLFNYYAGRGFWGNVMHTLGETRVKVDLRRAAWRLVGGRHAPFEEEKKGE